MHMHQDFDSSRCPEKARSSGLRSSSTPIWQIRSSPVVGPLLPHKVRSALHNVLSISFPCFLTRNLRAFLWNTFGGGYFRFAFDRGTVQVELDSMPGSWTVR